MLKSLVVIISFFLIAADNSKTDRRGFFKKIRDAYIEGRMTKNEKRIMERKEAEKMRRRQVFERNVKSLVDGVSKRLKHRRSTVSIIVIGSVALVVWLCHKGSVGCDRSQPSSLHFLSSKSPKSSSITDNRLE